MPYPNEHSCRLEAPDKYVRLRRMNNFQDSGYDAIIGFKEGGGSEIQAIRYPKDDWTEARARSHCKGKDGSFEPASGEEAAASYYQFFASMHSPFEKDGKYYALFRAITTKPSGPTIPRGQKWRPSYASMRRCLDTFLKAPLIGPPSKGHEGSEVYGKPVDWTMPNGYADIIYELTKEAYDKVKSGEWHDVSPQVRGTKQHKEGEVIVLDEWIAEHLAFVDKGAFPNVEAIDWWQGEPDKWLRLAAELYQSHRNNVTDAEMTALGIHPENKSNLKDADGGISLTGENLQNSQTFQGADAWDTADAPDKFFAYVPESAKGPDGNKSERKIPLASIQKKDLDEDIIRNAVARLPQADIPASALPEVRRRIRAAAHSLGLELPSLEEGSEAKGGKQEMSDEEKTSSDQAKREDILKAEITRLQGELDKAKKDLAETKVAEPYRSLKLAHDRLQKEVQDLREDKIAQEQATKTALVNEVLDLRIEAGFLDPKDRVDALVKYSKFNEESLLEHKADAEAFILQAESSGPKAQFRAAKTMDLETSVRQRMGLPKLEKKESK